MGIGAIVSKDIGLKTADRVALAADKSAASAMDQAVRGTVTKAAAQAVDTYVPGRVAKVLDKAEPVLKLVLGQNWADFLTRRPLAKNAADQGPKWLTDVTTRLDGAKREAVGVSIRLGANLPTPVPGLTLVANSNTEALLRRTPKGALELVYGTEVDPGVAAQMRVGLSGGFKAGNVGLSFGGQAQASVQGQTLERTQLTYEFDPRSSNEMTTLASQLKGHLVPEGHRTGNDARPEGFLGSMKDLVHGKKALAMHEPLPPPALTSELAQQHLSQASFFQGARIDANVNAWLGVSLNQNGKFGFGGIADGLGLNWKQDVKPLSGKYQIDTWKKILGSGLDIFNSILPPSAGMGAAYDVGLEHTLDFERGQYVKTTVALNSDRSLFANGGAYGAWIGRTASKGNRYALTFDANGLKGIDYSLHTQVKEGLKRQKSLERQIDKKLGPLLPTNRKNDPLILTYSLKQGQLDALRQLTPEQLQGALPKVFDHRDAFDLTRVLADQFDRFELGGWFGVGLGPFVGGSVNLGAEHSLVAERLGKVHPSDPLPAERPWPLRQV